MIKTGMWIKFCLFSLIQIYGASAEDLGFRYVDGKCKNSAGTEGLNPFYFGQCSDFSNIILGKITLNNIDFSGSDFSGSSLQKVIFHNATLIGVNFSEAQLIGVEINQSKISDSNFKNVRFKKTSIGDCKISETDFSGSDLSGSLMSEVSCDHCQFKKSNLSGAILSDSLFNESDLSGTDLSGSELKNSGFKGSNLDDTLWNFANALQTDFSNTKGARMILRNSKLRKSEFSNAQWLLSDFRDAAMESSHLFHTKFNGSNFRSASLENTTFETTELKDVKFNRKTILPITQDQAIAMGMILIPNQVFLLWDVMKPAIDRFTDYLKNQGLEVLLSKAADTMFDGKEVILDKFDTVIHFHGETYNTGFPESGQMAMLDFVRGGGTYVSSEWVGYSFLHGHFAKMSDLVLFGFEGGYSGPILTPSTGFENHPLLIGIPKSFKVDGTTSRSKIRSFTTEPSKVLIQDSVGNPALVLRKVEKGQVIAFSLACTERTSNCLEDSVVRKLYANASYYEN